MACCAFCGKDKPQVSMRWEFVDEREQAATELRKTGLKLARTTFPGTGWWVCPDCNKRLKTA